MLKVTLDGKASVLLRSSNPEVWGTMASPDGRLLAMTEAGGPQKSLAGSTLLIILLTSGKGSITWPLRPFFVIASY